MFVGGGVTTLEAFAACKAVVTLPSQQTVPALASGMIRSIGLDKVLIAHNTSDYIDKVVHLLTNHEERIRIENKVCDHNEILYHNDEAVQEWQLVMSNVYHSL